MMKKFYLILLTAVAVNNFAQTTITKANNDFLIGTSVNSKNLLGTPDNSATGSNVIFNNSSLTDGTLITAQVSTPSAGDMTTFPGTTVKFDDGNGDLIYYKSSPTQLEITGAVVAGAVLNFSADNALYLKFPTAFGNTYNDTARGTFTTTAGSGLFRGTITTTADATGTLLLGSQSFSNVIRLKSVQTYNLFQSTDTFYIFSIGTLASTFYTYYDNLNRYPLFTSTAATIAVPLLSFSQTSSAAIAQTNPVLATQNNSTQNKVTAYPNPVAETLFFAGDFSNYELVKVLNMEGRVVLTQAITDGKVNLNSLHTGNYILQLSGKNQKDQSIQIIKK